jgi:hypothetical protein
MNNSQKYFSKWQQEDVLGDMKMNARSWTTWERYLPGANLQTRTGTAGLCLKPWDQILPEEGVEERMAGGQMLWRTWERYLHSESDDATNLLLGAAGTLPERVRV